FVSRSPQFVPKQPLGLAGERTMLQQTALRLSGLAASAPVVVCNEAHRFLVAEQLRQLKIEPRAVVLEPFGRNTAPAIALAALAASKLAEGDDPELLVLPADHVIKDVVAFQKAVRVALQAAQQGKLATFGIVPSSPDTGYGYIQRGNSAGIEGAYPIARFVEKPSAERAQEFLASGDYLWNSGMFLFRASRYLQELERFAPQIARVCRTA